MVAQLKELNRSTFNIGQFSRRGRSHHEKKEFIGLVLIFWAILFNFLLITLYACNGTTGIKRVDVNQSRHSTAAHRQWTWVSGDSKVYQLGDYSTKAVAAGTNKPGARYDSVSWTDSKDNLWLFGGESDTISAKSGNDLWKFEH